MTRSTSAASDWPVTKPRPSKLAQLESANASATAMQLLETDPNPDSFPGYTDAAARARLVDDIHLAHYAV